MPALRIKLPNAEATTHALRGPRVTVGRAPDNTIQIQHASISSHHAEFVAVDGRYELHDLRSTNRSYVEGKPVTECHLPGSCQILFGSVECEFEVSPPPTSKKLELPAPQSRAEARAEDSLFLEVENRALRERLHHLQRRFDILGSARLLTGRADLTPIAAAGDALKSISGERDDFRQQSAGLRLESGRLREELAMTARERDAARHAAEALQTERASLLEQLEQARTRVQQLETLAASPTTAATPPPPKPPGAGPIQAPPPPPGFRRKAAPVAPANPDRLPDEVRTFREILAQLSTAPTDPVLLDRAGEALAGIAANATLLGSRGLLRVVRAFQEVLRDFERSENAPTVESLRTMRHTGDLLTRLIEPRALAAGRDLAPARVLCLDDDADLRETVMTALRGAAIEVTGCPSAEDALRAVSGETFDTVLADLRLPEMDGVAFCARLREMPAYRRTPVLFLTVADTLDKRAETSLSGGNEFVAKPFNVAELVLKVECWTLKHQLRLE